MCNLIFDHVEQLAADFSAIVGAINSAHTEQRDIVETVRARMAADEQRVEARRAELQAAVKDNSRSETVRSLAQAELDGLDAEKYAPTAAECAAFDEATARGKQAVADLRHTRDELSAALAAARAALEDIKAKTTCNMGADVEIFANWLEGKEKEFNNL